MSDRLKELQHQRAIATEQLAWIDREIARETGQSAAAGGTPVAPAATGSSAGSTPADVERMADEIIARYKNEGAPTSGDVKRGCFLYFALAFGLLGLGVVALYFYSVSRQ